jgi:transposase InsO family protein
MTSAIAEQPVARLLGIVHRRIQAGRPQQNGRHERMHRTLKEDTTKPPAASLRVQQSHFDNFRYSDPVNERIGLKSSIEKQEFADSSTLTDL